MTAQISASQRERVIALYGDDISVSEIVRRTGLSRRQVDYALRDVTRRGQGWAQRWTKVQLETVIARLTKRLKHPPSNEQIGSELGGMSKQQVHQLLTRHSIKKPAAPGRALTFAQRNARQAAAAKKAKRVQEAVARAEKRDAKILAMAAHGKSRAEISKSLRVAYGTVSRVIRVKGGA